MPMIEKIVHTAKQIVKAIVESQSARPRCQEPVSRAPMRFSDPVDCVGELHVQELRCLNLRQINQPDDSYSGCKQPPSPRHDPGADSTNVDPSATGIRDHAGLNPAFCNA